MIIIDAQSLILGFVIAILGGLYMIFRMNRGE
jgi:hypothetical protein